MRRSGVNKLWHISFKLDQRIPRNCKLMRSKFSKSGHLLQSYSIFAYFTTIPKLYYCTFLKHLNYIFVYITTPNYLLTHNDIEHLKIRLLRQSYNISPTSQQNFDTWHHLGSSIWVWKSIDPLQFAKWSPRGCLLWLAKVAFVNSFRDAARRPSLPIDNVL